MNAEHVNVLILGAGLSGIGAACHLRRECPDKTFALLEARESIGGTWDLFRYPGIRSDSDMFTLGYSFQPWTEAKSIADGQSILRYVRDTAREYGIDRHIRFGRRATHARWSSTEANWTVEAVQICTGKAVQITCDFLYACTGYYRYDEPYAPRFPGAEHFEGQIIHPQHWPEGLEWAGRRVVVIGSGATAVTLVPALAELAAHVTMLQRSPSYILSVPNRDPLFERLRRHVSTRRAYAIVRWRNVLLTMLNFTLCRRAPRMMRKVIRGLARKQLPAEFDVDTHLNPTYNPWDQRLCLVPDGDLFQSLSSGTASIATGQIDTFVPEGIRLHSGETLAADIVIAATGLNLLFLGGLTLEVDGEAVDYADTIAYKGMMLSGVPNLAFTIGYTNASWTLKADLVAGYVCRLVQQMDSAGTAICVPRPPAASEPSDPIIDLKAGYVLRSVDTLPRQGARPPWRLHQNYLRDVRVLRHGPLDDGLELRARPRSHTEHAVAELAQRSV